LEQLVLGLGLTVWDLELLAWALLQEPVEVWSQLAEGLVLSGAQQQVQPGEYLVLAGAQQKVQLGEYLVLTGEALMPY